MATKLTKTQINYFEQRLSITERRALAAFCEANPQREELTKEEKLSQISRGVAQLKEIHPDKCYSLRLLEAFDYEDEDVIEAFNAAMEATWEKAKLKVSREKTRLLDDIVLGHIEPDEAVAKLENFLNLPAVSQTS